MTPPVRSRAVPRGANRLATVLAAVAVFLAAVACTPAGTRPRLASSPTAPAPTTTAAPPTAPAPDCGNPVMSFAPTADTRSPNSADSSISAVRQRGRLRVAVSADTLLFGFRNPLTGQLEGFDVDIAREVAKDLLGDPNKVDFKVVTYAQRIPALEDNSADMVADVMTVNCKRWAQINFSSEYFAAGQKVLVRTDSAVAGIGDLDGAKVCVAKGSTNIDELAKHPKVKAVPVDDVSDCMVLFQQGSVDAVTGDDTVLAGFVAQDPYAKVVGAAFTNEPYGLGVKKENKGLTQFINGVLERIRSDGTWKNLYQKWLKPTTGAPDPPPAVYGR